MPKTQLFFPSHENLKAFYDKGRSVYRPLQGQNLTVGQRGDDMLVRSYDLSILRVTPDNLFTLQGFQSTQTTQRHVNHVCGRILVNIAPKEYTLFDGMQVQNGQWVNHPWEKAGVDLKELRNNLIALALSHTPNSDIVRLNLKEENPLVGVSKGKIMFNVLRSRTVREEFTRIIKKHAVPLSFGWKEDINLSKMSGHEILEFFQCA